ncbi:MAG: type II CAAX prenyl endopeptidase Rce1 family protein [Peptoniphilus sp.]
MGYIISILSFVVVAFASYFLKIESLILNAVILAVIGILALLIIDKNFLLKIFKPLKLKDLGYIVLGVIIMFVAIIISSIVLSKVEMNVSNNPIFDMIDKENLIEFFISSVIQFITEEIIFIIPFLFVINKSKIQNRFLKVLLAVLLSSVTFGLMHLSTYDFNFLQAILIISIVRTGLTMSYIISKNLTVTYIVHIIYDWSIILAGLQFAVNF